MSSGIVVLEEALWAGKANPYSIFRMYVYSGEGISLRPVMKEVQCNQPDT